MEQNGECIDENIMFTTVIKKCGNELTDIGDFLLKISDDIKTAHKAAMDARAKKSKSKKTYTHTGFRPCIEPPASEIQVDDDVFYYTKT